jgi:hypothetical protein
VLVHSNFRIVLTQAVIFTPDVSSFSQTNFLATVLGKYASRFDGPVQAMPFGDTVSPEIPRVILESKDHNHKVQGGPSRVDSFFVPKEPDEGTDVTPWIEVLEYYVRSSEIPVRVGRMALVIQRVMEEKNPANLLIDHFCKEESKRRPFRNSENFEIHNHKHYTLKDPDIEVNSWVRCKATVERQPTLKELILVEQDINALAEDIEKNAFDADSLHMYFSRALAEANGILRVYFPGGN